MDTALVAWVEQTLGRCRIAPLVTARPTRNRVQVVETEQATYILKAHQTERAWQAEVFAYQNWASAPPFAPLVAGCSAPRAILTRRLPGEPLEGAALDEATICAVWREAGRLAAQVHGQACGSWFGMPDCHGHPLAGAKLDSVSYFSAELGHWLRRAEQLGLLDRPKRQVADWALSHCNLFADEVPCPVDRDFTPGNWLVAAGRLSGVIDLEEMRWGIWLEGFAHLWLKFAFDQPHREAAFFVGYGRDPRRECPDKVRLVCLRHALATLVLGAEIDSLRHVRLARRMLAHLETT